MNLVEIHIIVKLSKIILITLFALVRKQGKSQCADSIKVSNSFTDSLVFQIYTSTPNDTTTLIIYNIWGQVVKKVLNDSVMQLYAVMPDLQNTPTAKKASKKLFFAVNL